MEAVPQHGLLGLAIVMLWCASWRASSAAGADGLIRVIATATLSAALAGAQALALGIVALGANPWALTAGALLTLVASRRAFPRSPLGVAVELSEWWADLGSAARLAAGGLVAAGGALAAWFLWYAAIGFDSSIYHYLEVASWVDSGRPGTVVLLGYDLPFGSYPRTNELLGTWLVGIGRSFVPLGVWPVAVAALLGASTWAGLRALAVPRLAAGLAVAAILSAPWVVRQLSEPLTDLPALAWLSAAGALTAASARQPPLVVFALLAGGLALGTKTTVLIPLLAVVAAGIYMHRGRLSDIRTPLVGVAGALALLLGASWYLVNLISHGSPLWPFATAPWGTNRPPFVDMIDTRLIENFAPTLDAYRDQYEFFAGIPVLLGACLVIPAFTRSRPVRLSAGLLALSVLAFAFAPVTGVPEASEVVLKELFPTSALRYLLPAVLVAVVTLGLAARGSRTARRIAIGALAVASAWNLIECVTLGKPFLPNGWLLGVAAAAGVLIALAPIPVERLRRLPRLAVPALCLSALAMAGLAAPGYPARSGHASESTAIGYALLPRALRALESYPEDIPIAFATRIPVAALAGDHFQHPLSVLPPNDPCETAWAAADEGFVVVSDPSFARGLVGVEPFSIGRCFAQEAPLLEFGAYRLYSRAEPDG